MAGITVAPADTGWVGINAVTETKLQVILDCTQRRRCGITAELQLTLDRTQRRRCGITAELWLTLDCTQRRRCGITVELWPSPTLYRLISAPALMVEQWFYSPFMQQARINP